MRNRLNSSPTSHIGVAVGWLLVVALCSARASAGAVRIGAAFNTFDFDGDGIADVNDNAPGNSNPSQTDSDQDGIGDARDLADGSDADLDGDGFFDTFDANPEVASVWSFAVTLTGPQTVTPGLGLSIPMTIAGGNNLGPTGVVWAGWPDYVVLELQVDGGLVAAHWIGGHSETSLDLTAGDLIALGLDIGSHSLTATASDLVVAPGPSSTIQIVPIPEPSTVTLAAIGLVGFGAFGWRRRKR
jgi:PEP-CTERM motif/Thrombospondin type 3 repeat